MSKKEKVEKTVKKERKEKGSPNLADQLMTQIEAIDRKLAGHYPSPKQEKKGMTSSTTSNPDRFFRLLLRKANLTNEYYRIRFPFMFEREEEV